MNGNQLFAKLSDDLAGRILNFFRDTDREVYKNTIATLAGQRNLRPVFVMKKSREQQLAWLHKTLKLRFADEMAGNLIQLWLMKERTDMLSAFLDGLGIEHDGEGSVEEDLPETLDPDKLKSAMDGLFDAFDDEEVHLYLTAFQTQMEDGWPELNEAMEKESRCTWSS